MVANYLYNGMAYSTPGNILVPVTGIYRVSATLTFSESASPAAFLIQVYDYTNGVAIDSLVSISTNSTFPSPVVGGGTELTLYPNIKYGISGEAVTNNGTLDVSDAVAVNHASFSLVTRL